MCLPIGRRLETNAASGGGYMRARSTRGARRCAAGIIGMVAAAGALGVARAATDYAQPGPHTFKTTDLVTFDAGAIGGKLVVPDDAGPFPILVTSHGWSAS